MMSFDLAKRKLKSKAVPAKLMPDAFARGAIDPRREISIWWRCTNRVHSLHTNTNTHLHYCTTCTIANNRFAVCMCVCVYMCEVTLHRTPFSTLLPPTHRTTKHHANAAPLAPNLTLCVLLVARQFGPGFVRFLCSLDGGRLWNSRSVRVWTFV